MKTLRIGVSVLIALFLTFDVCYAQSTAEESYKKGVEYGTQGKFKEAKEEFEKVLKVAPFYEPAKGGLKIIEDVTAQKIKSETAIHLFKGIDYFNKGMLDETIAEFNKAIEINPGYAEAYDDRGLLYMVNLGNKQKACSDWKQACELGLCENYELAKRKRDCE